MTITFAKKLSLSIGFLAGVAFVPTVSTGAAAQAAAVKTINTPAQPLADTLRQIGRMANAEIIFQAADVRGKRARAITGARTAAEAIDRALAGSALSVRRTQQGAYLIQQNSPREIQAEGSDEQSSSPNEVIVTASKRAEPLREIAGSVSAQTGEQLAAIGAQEFRDYLTRAPGVAFNEGPPQNSTVVIRGVGTSTGLDQGQGTTGYFINDIPLTEPGYTVIIPDVDAFDVERVEVLRGPQGSLFGSASLGGAINYISKLADPTKIDAALEGGLTTTARSAGEIGYRAKGMINVPLVADKLAARLTVTQRTDPGYLDNIGTGIRGSNDVANLGVRGSIVFTPDPDTKLSYLGLYYRTRTDDKGFAQTNLGPFKRSTGFETRDTYQTQIHALRMDHDFGGANVSLLASYNLKDGDLIFDFGPLYGALNPTEDHVFLQAGSSKTWSFEGRVASEQGGTLDWLIGATYINTEKRFEEHLTSRNFAAAQPAAAAAGLVDGDEYYFGYGDTKGEEMALFGELALNLGDLTLTGGGRLFDNRQVRSGGQYLFFFPTGPNITLPQKLTDNGFTPKVSAKYTFNRDAMVYALASKGFRFGSPNLGLLPLAGFVTPDGTTSDTLWNYEVGTRLSFIDRKLTVDVTGFQIDWTNLQVRLIRPDGFTYGANAGAARIRGVETTIGVNTGGFSYALNATYLDAKITESIPTATGLILPGKRLPSAAKWRISNTASYNFGGAAEPTVTLMHRYVSDSPGYINDPAIFPSYHLFDARASVKLSSFDLALFVNNIGNRQAITFAYVTAATGNEQFYVRPRTFGIQASWSM